MVLRLGCAVWAYRGWLGGLYPPQTKASEFLSTYSRRLSAVEGNAPFYAIPSVATLAQWREATPTGFKFCPKLFRGVTHRGSLSPQLAQAQTVLARLQHLGDRLGPVMIQLPPSYGPNQMEDLSWFLKALPAETSTEIDLAVEVRHPDWFSPATAPQLNDGLQHRGAGRILLDTRPVYESPDDPQQQSQRRKPRLPLQPVVTAPFTIVRYIGHPDLERNRGYLDEWAGRIASWLQQGTVVYLFIHCPQEARSPAILEAFHQSLVAAGAVIPPLTWGREPDQLSLF
ncbi:MAG: DUF72 domain-containing protein [Cyanobacteria bacterium P01_A01_bin.135]